MGIFGIAKRGFGMLKKSKKKGSGPGLSDFYYKPTKDRPTILSEFYYKKTKDRPTVLSKYYKKKIKRETNNGIWNSKTWVWNA